MMNFDKNPQSLLTFRVGPVLCCAPSFPVRSIITPPKLTQPPGSDASQPGIFKHGSHIVKVLDLRQKFGIEKSEHVHPGNLIITVFENDSFAFWVDQILDVFDFPSVGWGNLPAAIPRGVFSRTLLLNKKIHLYSEFEKLATINDLGYLKHYIQQLAQEDKKSSDLLEKDSVKNKSPKVKRAKPDDSQDEISIKKSIKPAINCDKVTLATPAASEVLNVKTPPPAHSSANKEVYSSYNKKTKNIPLKSMAATAILNSTSLKKIPAKISPKTFETQTQSIKKETESHDNVIKDNESSFIPILFFLFFFLALLGAGGYFLFYEIVSPSSQHINEIKSQSTTDIKITNEIQDEEEIPPEEITDSSVPILEQANNDYSSVQDAENISAVSDNYRAEIVQNDNEITITIHQPMKKEETSSIETRPTQAIVNSEVTESITESKPLAATIEVIKSDVLNEKKLASKKIINEVIHIVVKGDTLWAIAKKYVDDPFLYPELARLSNIKNPHRIYPGNRVRIRFIMKN